MLRALWHHPHARILLLVVVVFISLLLSTTSSHPFVRKAAPQPTPIHIGASREADTRPIPIQLSYREHLELTTSPASLLNHSRTLTFDTIYVLSLPSRKDRRRQMKKLAEALDVQVEFVDASDKNEGFVGWIAERVKEVREKKRRLIAKERGMDPNRVGGLTINPIWLSPTLDEEGEKAFPPYRDRWYPANWVEHLLSADLSTLFPTNDYLNVTSYLHDPVDPNPSHQLNEGVISTFWGHTKVMRRMLEKGDKSALVLEDDVDIEWDIEKLWAGVERALPDDWGMTFLGHCFGQELIKPQVRHPLLHRSSQPLCLHAYALTSTGASDLLKLLNNPWNAFLTAIDTAIPTYISQNLFPNSFSVEPQLVIQRKDTRSDIQAGEGSPWRGVLRDSTWDRIRLDEGEKIPDEDTDDPALRFRYRPKKTFGH